MKDELGGAGIKEVDALTAKTKTYSCLQQR